MNLFKTVNMRFLWPLLQTDENKRVYDNSAVIHYTRCFVRVGVHRLNRRQDIQNDQFGRSDDYRLVGVTASRCGHLFRDRILNFESRKATGKRQGGTHFSTVPLCRRLMFQIFGQGVFSKISLQPRENLKSIFLNFQTVQFFEHFNFQEHHLTKHCTNFVVTSDPEN